MTILLTLMCWNGLAWTPVQCGEYVHSYTVDYNCTKPISIKLLNGKEYCIVATDED